jgi:hypothetical protein
LRWFHGEKDRRKCDSKKKIEKCSACIVCSEKLAMECRQLSTKVKSGTRERLSRLLNGEPQFVGRPEGEVQWQNVEQNVGIFCLLGFVEDYRQICFSCGGHFVLHMCIPFDSHLILDGRSLMLWNPSTLLLEIQAVATLTFLRTLQNLESEETRILRLRKFVCSHVLTYLDKSL